MFTMPCTIFSKAVAPIMSIPDLILAAGGTLGAAEISAINSYMNAIAPFKSKAIAIWGLRGGTAGSHAINWASPGSLDINWVGSPTHDGLGTKFNGSASNRGETGFNPANQTQISLSLWSSDGDSRMGAAFATVSGSRLYAGLFNAGDSFYAITNTSELYGSGNKGRHAVGQRSGASELGVYVDGTMRGSSNETARAVGLEIYLGCLNIGGPVFPQAANSYSGHFGIWNPLTETEIATLYSAEAALQATRS